MDLLKEISKYPVFKIERVEKRTGNIKTAYSAIGRLIKNGYVVKVRNNIYSPVDLSTGLILANRYQIACAIKDDAYIAYRTALEYHGLANQVFNEVYVSTSHRFNSFEYAGITYKYIKPKISEGVVKAINTTNIKMTDIERTVIDSIHQINKITGYEELIYALESISFLDEDKLINYLVAYDIQTLYQKTGFILEKYQKSLNISKHLLNFCQSKIKNNITYLIDKSSSETKFNKTWQLMEPILHDVGDDELV